MAQNLIDIIEKISSQRKISKINRIGLKIGEMAMVDQEALSFCIAIAAKGTCAEGAEVHFEVSPLMGECQICGSHFKITDFIFRCSSCGSLHIKTVSGQEIKVSYLDVENARSIEENS